MSDIETLLLLAGMVFAFLFGVSNTRMFFLKRRTESALETLNFSKRVIQIMAEELASREIDVNDLVNSRLSQDDQ